MTRENARMQSAGRRALDQHASTQRLCKRVAEEIDAMPPSLGIPIEEISDEDSLATTIKDAVAVSDEAIAAIATARTRSKDI